MGDITPTQITQQAGAGIDILSLNATTLPAAQTGTVLQIANADTTASRLEIDSFGASAYLSVDLRIRRCPWAARSVRLTSGTEIGQCQCLGLQRHGDQRAPCGGPVLRQRTGGGTNQGTYADIAATPNGGTAEAQIAQFNGSGGILIPGTVTGGDKGAGTINAAGFFVNGLPTPRILFAGGPFTAVTASTATSMLASPTTSMGSLTIPGNTLFYVGQKLEIEMAGIYSTAGTGGTTPTYTLSLGATTVAQCVYTGALTASLTNKVFAITRLYFTVTATGGSGALSVVGQVLAYTTASVSSGFFAPSTAGAGTPITIDLTSSQAFDWKTTIGGTGNSFQILGMRLITH